MLAEPTSNVKLAIYEYYSHPARAGPINDTRDTNIVGVGPTAQEKLHIDVSQGSGRAKMTVQKRSWVLGFWDVSAGCQGAGMPQCKIVAFRTMLDSLFHFEPSLNPVSLGPNLTSTLVWSGMVCF